MSVDIYKTGVIQASGENMKANLLQNTTFERKSTVTAWNQEKNGTLTAWNWGGYNSGVSNPTTVYHAHLTLFNGEYVYRYIRTADETWLGISQGGLQSVIQPNTIYTWSIDEYRPTGANNYITAGLYYKKTSDGSYNFHSGCPHGDGRDLRDQWVRRKFTFTTGDVYTGSSIIFYIYGYSGGNGTIYMRRPKLEVNSFATAWTPHTSEGYVEGIHGFSEQGNEAKIFKNYVEAKEFIEL